MPVNFVSKIIKFSIPSWVGFLTNIISTVIITRYFLPDTFGLISTFNAASTLVMSLVCLGFDSGFIRYFHEAPDGLDRNRLFLFSISAPILMLLVISAVTFVVASQKLSLFILGVDNYFIVGLLFVNVAELIVIRFFTIYFRMQGNAFLYGFLTITVQLAMKGALVVAAFIKPNYEFSILLSVAATAVVTLVCAIFCGKRLFQSKKNCSVNEITIAEIKSLKPFVLYSIYSWPTPIVLYSNILAAQMIIRMTLGAEAVGIFTAVNIFIGIISVIQNGFVTFWSGYMFENYKSESAKIIKMHDYVSFVLIVIMISFMLFRDPIYYLIGSEYQSSKSFFALLLLYPLLYTLSETTAYGISIAKKSHLILMLSFIIFVLNIGISWLTIPLFGIVGACLGSAVSSVVFFTLQSYFGQRYYRSVESIPRTIFTVFTLVSVAFGNLVFFNESRWVGFGFNMTILILSTYVFRNTIREMKSTLLKVTLKSR
jgi:O-antigen/teichoic acid export membrane protein